MIRRLLPVAAATFAALAAWVSLGTIGFDVPGGARIGLLPVGAWAIVVAALAALVVWALTLRGAAAAVLPLLLVFLPWLPFPVPAAFLIWSGPVTGLVWAAVLLALIACQAPRGWHATLFLPPSIYATVAAGVLAALIYAIAAWRMAPLIPGGDEPHYLVITQSLLYDGDLKIENNHRRGDYHAYFAGDIAPDFIRRGRNGEIYSIHPIGLPVLVLPAFAIAGYRGVVCFLILVAAATAGLGFWLARRVTGSAGAAWFGWAAVMLSPPFLFHAFTVYPDGPAGGVVLTGVWALLRADWEREEGGTSVRPWFWHGLAVATLPWLHTRLVVVAAMLGGLVLVRLSRSPNPLGKAVAFLTVPAISALAWVAFFVVIYGTPDPTAPYGASMQSSFSYVPDGIGGLLFDQGFGLFATAPVLVFAFAGFARLRRLAVEWAALAIPYLLTVTTIAMWWGGASAPARFFVALLPPLTIPAAAAWAGLRHRATRAAAVAALVMTCWLTAVLVFGAGGRLAYNTRNEAGATTAPWAEWAGPVAQLPTALPAFVPQPFLSRPAAAQRGFLVLLPWVVCLVGVWLLLRAFSRARFSRAALTAATTLSFPAAAMIAATIVWRVDHAPGIATERAQMQLLRRIALDRVIALDLTAARRVPVAEVPARVRIVERVRPAAGRGARLDRPLFSLAEVPAGDYRLTVRRHGSNGWLMVGVGRDQFAILTQRVTAFDAGMTLRFPVDVRAVLVRGDEDARQQVDAIELRPASLLAVADRVSDAVAQHAVRYGTTTMFFMDDRSFPEPGASWIGGARTTQVVIAPDRPSSSQRLMVRNAPVDNTVRLESGVWREELVLKPAEEREVDVPIDPRRSAALVRLTASAGFRPSADSPGTTDSRFLGAYVRVVP